MTPVHTTRAWQAYIGREDETRSDKHGDVMSRPNSTIPMPQAALLCWNTAAPSEPRGNAHSGRDGTLSSIKPHSCCGVAQYRPTSCNPWPNIRAITLGCNAIPSPILSWPGFMRANVQNAQCTEHNSINAKPREQGSRRSPENRVQAMAPSEESLALAEKSGVAHQPYPHPDAIHRDDSNGTPPPSCQRRDELQRQALRPARSGGKSSAYCCQSGARILQ